MVKCINCGIQLNDAGDPIRDYQALEKENKQLREGGWKPLKEDVQMANIALDALKNNPWPTPDIRWEVIEHWLKQIIKAGES